MKKVYITLLSALFAGSAFAQTLSNDRMVIFDAAGNTYPFAVDRIQQITFPTVDGEASAAITVKGIDRDSVTFVVTRNDFCMNFKLDILPTTTADMLSDAAAAAYVDKNNKTVYSMDFTNGKVELASFGATPLTDYTAITVGLDQYGTPCGVSRANFQTLPAVLVGDPKVETVADSTVIGQREFSIGTLANADVKGYALLAGEKGSIQKQYKQFAPMFGYKNFGEMVKGWGFTHTLEEGQTTWKPVKDTWTSMDPGTEYEVFVQAWDANDNFAPCDTITITTQTKGGQGAASVDIALGDYRLTDWEGEQKYSQFITFTPNDQSSVYRFGVYKAEQYDADPEGANSYVAQDPPMPMANWFFYEPITTDFQIDPNTEAVAIAAAKNANGEWGTVCVKRFITPSATAPAAAPAMKANAKTGFVARQRHNFTVTMPQAGRLPKFGKVSTGVIMK